MSDTDVRELELSEPATVAPDPCAVAIGWEFLRGCPYPSTHQAIVACAAGSTWTAPLCAYHASKAQAGEDFGCMRHEDRDHSAVVVAVLPL